MSGVDPREAEEAVAVEAALGEGVCPWSGLRLSPPFEDAWGRLTRACGVCDCFGFDPEDPRLSPKG